MAGPTPDLVPLYGSELPKLKSVEDLGKVKANKRVEVAIHVRPQSETAPIDLYPDLPADHLTLEDFESEFSASPEDMDAVTDYITEIGGTKINSIPEHCTVTFECTAKQCNDAFDIELRNYSCPRGSYFGHPGPVHVPSDLIGVIEAVTGLDDIVSLTHVRPEDMRVDDLEEEIDPPTMDAGDVPQQPPVLQSVQEYDDWQSQDAMEDLTPLKSGGDTADGPMSVLVPPGYYLYYPSQVAELYDFPEEYDGTGETIAIISMDGMFDQNDIDKYFDLQGKPRPHIEVETIGQPRRAVSHSMMEDFELTMDLQVAGSVAPGAKLVVFRVAPGTRQPYMTALRHAIQHPEHRPSIVSISYGSAEGLFKEQDLKISNDFFAAVTRMGITICATSGDAGSASRDYASMQPPPGPHVNFPASSPYVLACGGTATEVSRGRITREYAWNDHNQCRLATAGGISKVFERPEYQRGLDLPKNPTEQRGFDGRGVPDVSANASLKSGYRILFGNRFIPNGGTSAAAPLWAGLIARLNQALGRRLGFFHPHLYKMAGTAALNDITEGNNGCYKCGEGWDACTGHGTPNGREMLNELRRILGTSDKGGRLQPFTDDPDPNDDKPQDLDSAQKRAVAENVRSALTSAQFAADSAMLASSAARACNNRRAFPPRY